MHGFHWLAALACVSAGQWADLVVSTLEGEDTTTAGGGGTASGKATVYLGYLRSFRGGMGLAVVKCIKGCTCADTLMDGRWEQKVSLLQVHGFPVSQHAKCRIRVAIVPRDAGSGKAAVAAAGGGSKFQLTSIMVAHTPVVLSSYAGQLDDFEAAADG